MTAQPNPKIQQMKNEFIELKEAISRERKKGGDVLIAELKIAPFQSKLKMAEATMSENDFFAARKIIESARQELGILPAKQSFKSIPSVFDQIESYLLQAKNAIKRGQKEEASKFYSSIRDYFPALSKEEKKQVLPECSELLKAIK
jgi:septation ring formation regulator EzrA